MRREFLPFSPPLIGEEEIAEVIDTLRSDWITTGPKVKRFEEEFAQFVGAPAALAVNSGTAALHVALAVLGVGPGDLVVTTPMTFCSTVHVIEQMGARPLLVDVEPTTLNLDPQKTRKAVAEQHGLKDSDSSGRVKALLPVHLYGHPCDMDALCAIAREYGLAIVEDAAHALPACYRGQLIGSRAFAELPILSCFSFYATKNMTTGEGGMLTGPAALIEAARIWSLHGMSRDAYLRYQAEGSWHYDVVCAGFKYNLTDMQAAIGLHQLHRLPQFHSRRREIALCYNRAFAHVRAIQIPTELPEVEHAWHLYLIRLNPEQFRWWREGQDTLGIRSRFISELKARGIGASVHFIPVHTLQFYRDKYGYRGEDFPVAYREYQRLVSLPIYPKMSDGDVQDVIEAVCDLVAKHGI